MSAKRRQKGTGGVIPRNAKNGDTTFYVQFYDADRIKVHAGKVEVPDPDGVFPRNSKGRESEGWTLSLGGELAGRNLSETQPWALPASKVICRTLLPTMRSEALRQPSKGHSYFEALRCLSYSLRHNMRHSGAPRTERPRQERRGEPQRDEPWRGGSEC
jgi:hypothetical protein